MMRPKSIHRLHMSLSLIYALHLLLPDSARILREKKKLETIRKFLSKDCVDASLFLLVRFIGWARFVIEWESMARHRVNALAFYVYFAFKLLFSCVVLSTHVHKSIASFLHPFSMPYHSMPCHAMFHQHIVLFSQTKSISLFFFFAKFDCFTRPFRGKKSSNGSSSSSKTKK